MVQYFEIFLAMITISPQKEALHFYILRFYYW